MRVILAEDEITASRKLAHLLLKADPSIEIVASPESVKAVVDWLRHHEPPDLAFFDVRLSDALSFEIFDRCKIGFPVIFVTAYDDYLLKAFDHNAVHYLLKPVTEEKLKKALQKVSQLKTHFLSGMDHFLKDRKVNATRILVHKGAYLIPLDASGIAYAFTEHKICFVRSGEGDLYVADQTLTELEERLDPVLFFRANRQYLVNRNFIVRFKSIEQSKILLELKPSARQEVIIGKQNAVGFRKWIKDTGLH
ncbi:MAG TPA: LytTR family DNA-binding domain-containing protein [Saprospiraceae bacterium]|nr:LytTR family DNA-binding domain-containing protein [Saprospiraceae bacterium]HNT19208.1 LytTR family DNA-binding domain-containing protein [Saprospiraceae bacterium]